MFSGRLYGGGGGLDDPEGDFDAALDEEMLDTGACGSCDGPFDAPEELPNTVDMAIVPQTVYQLSRSTRKYLYSIVAISDREFNEATPYTQACINRYIDGLNVALEGAAAIASVAPAEDRVLVDPGVQG